LFIGLSEQMRTMKDPDDATIGLLFGVITVIAGFAGVTIGSVAAQIWRRTNPKADPLVCGIGVLLCVPFLFFALTFVQDSMPAAWACVFFTVTALSLNWAVVPDILMYIVTPSRRATASAFNILFSHLLGDAASPYLIGIVSDAIRDGNDSPAAKFYSLKHAMYINAFVLVLGGFFFLGTAWYVESDRKRTELLAKGLLPDDANTSTTPITPTLVEQNGYGGISDSMAPSDSRAYLISPDDDTANETPVRYRF